MTTSSDLPRRHFADFSLARQLWEGFGCAALAGAVSGLALGTSLWLYLATAGLASVAGLPAATQHSTLKGALVRTSFGGTVWAAAVLIVFSSIGNAPVMPSPDPVWYLVLTTVPATLVGWLVWAWTHRSDQAAVPALSS